MSLSNDASDLFEKPFRNLIQIFSVFVAFFMHNAASIRRIKKGKSASFSKFGDCRGRSSAMNRLQMRVGQRLMSQASIPLDATVQRIATRFGVVSMNNVWPDLDVKAKVVLAVRYGYCRCHRYCRHHCY